jgi:drug/metabolite transporter (DMT)-like permease
MTVPDDPLDQAAPSARVPATRDAVTWAAFLSLAAIWGSSFLFIHLALEEGVLVFTLTSVRTLAGALFLGLALVVTRGRLPATKEAWRTIVGLGAIQIVFPFLCLAWGQQYIPTGMGAVLNALVPLFAVVLASLVLLDEPITVNRLVGVLVGFGGVVVLSIPSLARIDTGDDSLQALLGIVAMAFASFWYALAAVYARHRVTGRRFVKDRDGSFRAMSSLELAFAQILVGSIMLTTLALVFERPPGGLYHLPPTATAWFALIWLGVLGTGVAYVLFYRIMSAWGATRTTLVTYMLPIVAIVLGFVFLGERLSPIELGGAALVLAGIVLVNASVGRRVLFARGRSVDRPLDAA